MHHSLGTSHCDLTLWKGLGISTGSFERTGILLWRPHPHDPHDLSTSPRPHLLILLHWAFGFQNMNFREPHPKCSNLQCWSQLFHRLISPTAPYASMFLFCGTFALLWWLSNHSTSCFPALKFTRQWQYPLCFQLRKQRLYPAFVT